MAIHSGHCKEKQEGRRGAGGGAGEGEEEEEERVTHSGKCTL